MAALRKKAASKETPSKETEKTTAKKASKAEAAETKAAAPVAARKTTPARRNTRDDAPVLADSRAFQRNTRQSPYKMRLVIDQIRGKNVNDALGLLKFSKKGAAKQIEKVLNSAVANAEYSARRDNESLDVDTLFVKWAVVNEGPKIKRFMPAAQGRATPIQKRTSHVEIVIGAKEGK
jgi:large subunit ribosomal protein L22